MTSSHPCRPSLHPASATMACCCLSSFPSLWPSWFSTGWVSSSSYTTEHCYHTPNNYTTHTMHHARTPITTHSQQLTHSSTSCKPNKLSAVSGMYISALVLYCIIIYSIIITMYSTCILFIVYSVFHFIVYSVHGIVCLITILVVIL